MPINRVEARTALLAAVLVTTFVAAPASATLEMSSAMRCGVPARGVMYVQADTPQGIAVQACGLVGRPVRFGDVGLSVPRPGFTSSVEAFGDEVSRELSVTVTDDGEMFTTAVVDEVVISSPEPAMRSTPQARLQARRVQANGCDSYAYNFTGRYVVSRFEFFRGDGTTPAGSTAAAFGDAMWRAATNITAGQSPCDSSDGVDVGFNYAGGTSTEADIDSAGNCLSAGAAGDDTVNTVDMGPMPTSYKGLMCYSSNSVNNVVEADIRLNSSVPWTYTPGDSACLSYYRYDVEGVLTHEFGHVFGLTHVGEQYATMYTYARSCDNWQRSLGRGDLNGLRALY